MKSQLPILALALITSTATITTSAGAADVAEAVTASSGKAPEMTREIASSREVVLDPKSANDLPGSRLNQAEAYQYHNQEDEKARLRDEAMTRRMDRLIGTMGRDR